MSKQKATEMIRITKKFKQTLDDNKLVEREAYHSVIERMVKEVKK